MSKKDYYDVLGVNKSASKDEIKKAFHKMAHKYHPDKKGGDEARFKEASEAYQVLSDDKKRAQYDQFGHSFGGGQGYGNQGGGQGFGGFGGFEGFDFSNAQGFDMGDLGDIFSEFFGGGMGGRGQTKRGRDMSTEISVTFSESVFGVDRKIFITKMSVCDTCTGSGAKLGTKFKKCDKCNGQGKIQEMKRSFLGTFSNVRVCDKCNGKGEIPEDKCQTCRGDGVLKKQEEINIPVPAGIRDGETLRLSGMGEAIAHGHAGDLYVKINVAPHPIFKRDGANLTMQLDLKLTEAILGSDREIDTLDGKITVKIPEGVSSGEILRVKDKGVPVGKHKRGDLMIKLVVKTPTKLSRNVREIIEKLRKEGI